MELTPQKIEELIYKHIAPEYYRCVFEASLIDRVVSKDACLTGGSNSINILGVEMSNWSILVSPVSIIFNARKDDAVVVEKGKKKWTALRRLIPAYAKVAFEYAKKELYWGGAQAGNEKKIMRVLKWEDIEIPWLEYQKRISEKDFATIKSVVTPYKA